MKTNFHTHTVFCDGKNTAEEMVLAAIQKGFERLGFSAHSMYPYASDWHLENKQHAAYTEEIHRLQKKYAGQIEIFLGFEADYIPGICSPRFENFSAFKPNFLIGSVHLIYNPRKTFAVDSNPPELADGIRDIYGGDVQKATGAYFSLQKEMLARGDFTILGHADLIRKFNGKLNLFSEDEEWYKKELQSLAEAIAKAGVITEINTGAISRGYMTSPYPSAYLLSLLHEKKVPVMINSDAHTTEGLDCAFDLAAELAKKAGYTEKAVLSSDGIQFVAL